MLHIEMPYCFSENIINIDWFQGLKCYKHVNNAINY